MKITEEIVVVDAFRMGKKDPPTIMVRMQKPGMVGKIFANLSNLKGLKNENKQKYYLNKQMPARKKEEWKRIQQIKQHNKQLHQSQKQTIEKIENRWMVNNEEYKKSVDPPRPEDILLQPATDRYARRKLQVMKGNSFQEEGSIFTGYSAFVANFEDIQKAYMNVREKHSDARHICCAYRLPGPEVARNQDYIDDGEWGGGRSLLEYLCDLNIFNRAIFVVRKYKGEHIGTVRFDRMKQAAGSAIAKSTRNVITGKEELPWTGDEIEGSSFKSRRRRKRLTTQPGEKIEFYERQEIPEVQQKETDGLWATDGATNVKTPVQWSDQELVSKQPDPGKPPRTPRGNRNRTLSLAQSDNINEL